MKKIFILCAILLISIIGRAQETDSTTLVRIGDKVPAFSVEMTNGKVVNIEDLKGKVVLINFWATWCGPCRAEFKEIPGKLLKKFESNPDFVFLPISRDEKKEVVVKFAQQNNYTFAMGIDLGRKIYSKFATQTIPRNFLVGKDGKILVCEIGFSQEDFDKLIVSIEEALK